MKLLWKVFELYSVQLLWVIPHLHVYLALCTKSSLTPWKAWVTFAYGALAVLCVTTLYQSLTWRTALANAAQVLATKISGTPLQARAAAVNLLPPAFVTCRSCARMALPCNTPTLWLSRVRAASVQAGSNNTKVNTTHRNSSIMSSSLSRPFISH